MKNLKKIFAGLMLMVFTVGMLAACGGDPVANELEQFLNKDMTAINEKYEALSVEMGKWEAFEYDAQINASITNVIIPNIDEALDLISKIELKTDEVNELKDKYEEMLTAYKAAFATAKEAIANNDAEMTDEASNMLEAAANLYSEYKNKMEELANQKGLMVEY